MKQTNYHQIYALGPTACAAHPKVLKNIAKQFDEHGIVSTQELRIARRMGIVATTPVARLGFAFHEERDAVLGAKGLDVLRP